MGLRSSALGGFLLLALGCASVDDGSLVRAVTDGLLHQSTLTVEFSGDEQVLNYGELRIRPDKEAKTPAEAAVLRDYWLDRELNQPTDHRVRVPGRLTWTVGNDERLTLRFDTRGLQGEVVMTVLDPAGLRPPLRLSSRNALGSTLVRF